MKQHNVGSTLCVLCWMCGLNAVVCLNYWAGVCCLRLTQTSLMSGSCSDTLDASMYRCSNTHIMHHMYHIYYMELISLCINCLQTTFSLNKCEISTVRFLVKPCSAELLQLYFSSFEAGIANPISSFK